MGRGTGGNSGKAKKSRLKGRVGGNGSNAVNRKKDVVGLGADRKENHPSHRTKNSTLGGRRLYTLLGLSQLVTWYILARRRFYSAGLKEIRRKMVVLRTFENSTLNLTLLLDSGLRKGHGIGREKQ